ncbi:MAG: Npt1/Npt2 family nucleotide transporter [Anaerolineales bacterium]
MISRLLRLQPGEAGLVLSLGALLLLNAMARQVSGIVGVSGFLSEGGVNQILIVLAVDYLFILLMTGVQSLIVDRFDRIKLLRAMVFGFALVFVIVRMLFVYGVARWLVFALLYIIAEQQWLVFPLVFWVLANDILSMAQAKRLFPIIASFGFAGKLLGSVVTGVTPTLFADLKVPGEEVLLLNVLFYLLAYLVMAAGLRRIRVAERVQRSETVRETLSEGWGFVKEVSAFRYLMFALVALTLSDTIIEFRFLVITDAAFPVQADYQRFYSIYSFLTTLVAFLIQGFVTSRLIGKVNIKNTFFLLPLAQTVGSLWMIGLPGLLSGIGALVLQRLSRDTIDESSRKAFFSLVPDERRGRVSLFMESYVPACGTIAACGIAGAIVFAGIRLGIANYYYIYLAVAFTAALFALWSIRNMRAAYDQSMLNWRLTRRRRRSSVLDKLEL